MTTSDQDDVIFEGELASDPISGATVAPKTLEKIEAPHANGAAQPSNPPAKATPEPILSFNEAVEATRTALRNINELRMVANLAARKTAAARAELTRAIDAWTAGCGAPMTQLEAARAYIASGMAEREKRLADIPPQFRNRYGNAAAFARTQRAVPPGVDPNALTKGSSRGAFPRAWRGRVDPRYVPPAPKGE